MYDRILLPVDGSETATRAARCGLALARVYDATVDVLHVVETGLLRLARNTREEASLRERGEEILDAIEAVAAEHGQSVTARKASGKPSVEITEYAVERDVDLIVLGRRGRTGVGERLLGGVTEQVLHYSPAPVLVVPDGGDGGDGTDERWRFERVLLPTDGSANAEAAVDHAVSVARRYGAEIHVLNVVDLQTAAGLFHAGGFTREEKAYLESIGREAVDRTVERIETADPDAAFESAVVQTAELAGVSGEIRAYVGDHDVDLVVLGSHGRSNLRRQLLGSVASNVLRTVDVPVLVVTRSE